MTQTIPSSAIKVISRISSSVNRAPGVFWAQGRNPAIMVELCPYLRSMQAQDRRTFLRFVTDGPSAEEKCPRGTMTEEEIEKEVVTAVILGGDITDTLLGYGICPEISFDGLHVGFAVFGLERRADKRLFAYLGQKLIDEGKPPLDAQALVMSAGKKMRAAHAKGRELAFSNLGNFSLAGESEVKIRDFDCSGDIKNILQSASVGRGAHLKIIYFRDHIPDRSNL